MNTVKVHDILEGNYLYEAQYCVQCIYTNTNIRGGSFVSPKPQGQLKNSLYEKWPFSPSLPFIQHLYPISLTFGLCFTWGYIAKYRDCKIFANSKYLWTCNSKKMTLKLEMNLMCFWQYSPVWCCVSSLKVCSQLCIVYTTTLHQPENFSSGYSWDPCSELQLFFFNYRTWNICCS